MRVAAVVLGGRVRVVAVVLGGRGRIAAEIRSANCEVAASTARRLGLGEGVERALQHMFEWWNGKGPQGFAGEEIAVSARIVRVASSGLLFNRLSGPETAVRAVGERGQWASARGRSWTPVSANASPALLSEVESGDALERTLEAEPRSWRLASGAALDSVARAFGDVVDLKSSFSHGHPAGVAGT